MIPKLGSSLSPRKNVVFFKDLSATIINFIGSISEFLTTAPSQKHRKYSLIVESISA